MSPSASELDETRLQALAVGTCRRLPLGLVWVGPDAHVVEMNDYARVLLGLEEAPASRVVGRHLSAFAPRWSRSGWGEVRAAVEALGAVSFEMRWIRDDGTPLQVEVRAIAVSEAELGASGELSSAHASEHSGERADVSADETTREITDETDDHTDVAVQEGGPDEGARIICCVVRERDVGGPGSEPSLDPRRRTSAYLANASHELRTPLNSILGYVQLLARDASLSPEQRRAVETIRRSGDHLLALINDILDLSSIEADTPDSQVEVSRFDVGQLLTSLLTMMQVQAGQKGLSLEFELLGEPLPRHLCGDEAKLRQVLANLLSNAIKFTPTGSVVLRAIRVDDGHHPRRVRVRFEVEDTGLGIPEEKIDSIFQPFHQLEGKGHRAQRGTGLGLTISWHLVHRMGGALELESEVGEGTRFEFTLGFVVPPDSEGVVELPEMRVVEPRRLQGASHSVLVVDDSETSRNLVETLLAPLGFDVFGAHTGEEAVTRARALGPDVVIMDLVMPGIGGIEAIERLRADPTLDNTVIIGLSARVRQKDRRRCLDAGADEFLTKPLETELLLQTLQTHLELDWEQEPEATADATVRGRESQDMLGARPSPETLAPLLEAASSGRIVDVRHELDRLREEADPMHQPFLGHLADLARQFEVEQIAAIIREG